jgi:hypothetical protein
VGLGLLHDREPRRDASDLFHREARPRFGEALIIRRWTTAPISAGGEVTESGPVVLDPRRQSEAVCSGR